jgi:hypothetical protein
MHHTARTAPGTSSARPLAAAVLAAVVLTLLAALGLAGPAATGGPTADVAPTADLAPTAGHDRHSAPRADDGCDTACTARAATRQEPHREHPAPRCHLAPCAQGSTAVTPPAQARLSTQTRHAPSASDPHASHDRGRAPPDTSGT